MNDNKQTFLEWFDPSNKNHIIEYLFLMEHGHWREGFIPDDMIMDNNWHILLSSHMALCWIEHMKYIHMIG